MTTNELEEILKSKGFKEERLDSGCNYTKTVGAIELICYVEPDIEVEFIALYQWENNEVKGAYNISVEQLKHEEEPVDMFFRKVKKNLPRYIGESIDTHTEVEKAIRSIFG